MLCLLNSLKTHFVTPSKDISSDLLAISTFKTERPPPLRTKSGRKQGGGSFRTGRWPFWILRHKTLIVTSYAPPPTPRQLSDATSTDLEPTSLFWKFGLPKTRGGGSFSFKCTDPNILSLWHYNAYHFYRFTLNAGGVIRLMNIENREMNEYWNTIVTRKCSTEFVTEGLKPFVWLLLFM